jgi:hypothetical protein
MWREAADGRQEDPGGRAGSVAVGRRREGRDECRLWDAAAPVCERIAKLSRRRREGQEESQISRAAAR